MGLTNAEKKKLYDLGMGMADEEREIMLMSFPSELMKNELKRREDIMSQSINKVKDIIFNTKSNMSLDEMSSMVNEIKEAVK